MSVLEGKLRQNLKAELNAVEGVTQLVDGGPSEPVADVAGSFIDVLFPILLDAVVELLGRCTSNNPLATAKRLENPGFVERWAIRKAVRNQNLEDWQEKPSRKAIEKTLEDATADELNQLLSEVEPVGNWGLW